MAETMFGRYVNGCGKAHLYGAQHLPVFGQEMVGTLNVVVPRPVTDWLPTLRNEVGDYWLVRLCGQWYAWAYRWDGSQMPPTTLELLSRKPLPDALKREGVATWEIEVEVIEA